MTEAEIVTCRYINEKVIMNLLSGCAGVRWEVTFIYGRGDTGVLPALTRYSAGTFGTRGEVAVWAYARC